MSGDGPICGRSAEREVVRLGRTADEGGSIIEAQLVVSPDGGLAAAIKNKLASAVSEGEAR